MFFFYKHQLWPILSCFDAYICVHFYPAWCLADAYFWTQFYPFDAILMLIFQFYPALMLSWCLFLDPILACLMLISVKKTDAYKKNMYFVPCFGKFFGAVSENEPERTNGRRRFYRTLRFSTGDQQGSLVLDRKMIQHRRCCNKAIWCGDRTRYS